jgi:hypothetical protein
MPAYVQDLEDTFREVMATVCTPVTVIAAMSDFCTNWRHASDPEVSYFLEQYERLDLDGADRAAIDGASARALFARLAWPDRDQAGAQPSPVASMPEES